MTIYKCSNPALWHPTLHAKQDHHHPPLAWRKVILAENPEALTNWWRIIRLCGLCHDEYHTLLNRYVKLGKTPLPSELKTYSPYLKDLVEETWNWRPQGRLPYTVAHEFTDAVFYKEH